MYPVLHTSRSIYTLKGVSRVRWTRAMNVAASMHGWAYVTTLNDDGRNRSIIMSSLPGQRIPANHIDLSVYSNLSKFPYKF